MSFKKSLIVLTLFPFLIGCGNTSTSSSTTSSQSSTTTSETSTTSSESSTTSSDTSSSSSSSSTTSDTSSSSSKKPTSSYDEWIDGYNAINVAEYCDTTGNEDCAPIINSLILQNPNRTLYFKDGTYLIKSPIMSYAKCELSTDFRLSAFAVIKADPNWEYPYDAMVMLGALGGDNDISRPGSYFGFVGGVLDGSCVANGLYLVHGRETHIENVSIKSVIVGMKIFKGDNSGSSDADISNCEILTADTSKSIGIQVDGFDNTITNVRIGRAYKGLVVNSEGNCFRNIHPLFYSSDYYHYESESAGFQVNGGANIFDYCYSDHYCNAFSIASGKTCIFQNCMAFWYADNTYNKSVIKQQGDFKSAFYNLRIGFRGEAKYNHVLSLNGSTKKGQGKIYNLFMNTTSTADEVYKDYLDGQIFSY